MMVFHILISILPSINNHRPQNKFEKEKAVIHAPLKKKKTQSFDL
jgi:hypothetical protein